MGSANDLHANAMASDDRAALAHDYDYAAVDCFSADASTTASGSGYCQKSNCRDGCGHHCYYGSLSAWADGYASGA